MVLAIALCSKAQPRLPPLALSNVAHEPTSPFRVDTWTPDGESIVDQVAGVEDYQVALATYRAACERWPARPSPCGKVRE